MDPKNTFNSWITFETDKKHSIAVKYIEENVDLIDTDLQKFMDDCPSSCQLEVYEMLLKAGIDMKDYVINSTLKHWINHIHDASPQFHQYYTIDYKQEMKEYINKTTTWEVTWQHCAAALDMLEGKW